MALFNPMGKAEDERFLYRYDGRLRIPNRRTCDVCSRPIDPNLTGIFTWKENLNGEDKARLNKLLDNYNTVAALSVEGPVVVSEELILCADCYVNHILDLMKLVRPAQYESLSCSLTTPNTSEPSPENSKLGQSESLLQPSTPTLESPPVGECSQPIPTSSSKS